LFIKKWIKRFFILSFIFISVIAISTTVIIKTSKDESFDFQTKDNIVNDITGLNPISVAKVITPKSIDEIALAIKNSEGPISIGGGRYSQGGQVAYEDSLHIDMRRFNKVVDFKPKEKEITVQTGITWRDIQEIIDPKNLSIKIMQTYANFTVGGSLSVNVHGRYIGEGPLVSSVKSIKIVLADGQIVLASRENNADIFLGAIGGYGGLGVIVEATLSLADNTKIERIVKKMPLVDYPKHFVKNVRTNPKIVMHNADIYPPDYDQALDVSWYESDKPLTSDDRVIAKDEAYYWGPRAAEFVADYDFGKWIREKIIDPVYYSFDRVVWRNWEASYDVKELEPKDRSEYTYVLREYFVPVENFAQFVPKMKKIFNEHDVNILNVSIRHVFADEGTLLSWAPKESFAFVVYYRQGVDPDSRAEVEKWSQEMIDVVISLDGSYYLPYQIFASFEQFSKAYPNYNEFFALKDKLDPKYRFRNQLWKKHYISGQNRIDKERFKIKKYYRGEEQTFLTIPEWYLVFNPKEYAEYLESKQNPSDFPFIESTRMYWRMYDRVLSICDDRYPQNSEYITMLKVIGISTTVEYIVKSAYENTIGRFTRWLANDKPVVEDDIIAQANRAYSNLIFYDPWYEFDFSSWVNKIWHEPDFFDKNFIRKTERKLSFSMEYGFKSLYAKLIKYAVQSSYEPSEGLIYLSVTTPNVSVTDLPSKVKVISQEENKLLISVPRWGDFSKIIPMLIQQGYIFNDISGNQDIAVSFVADSGMNKSLAQSDLIFKDKFVSDKSKARIVSLAKVSNLHLAIKEAQDAGYTLEHIYDY
tara:strand:- start:154021 stop:156459 length:2439 start_codon:yes stop_codon:yes gene_type:complete